MEIREAIDEESEQELTTEENNTTSGKDEEEGNVESFDSRLSFKAWLLQIDEQPPVDFYTLPDLNEAYVRLLKDATRCDTAFPEQLRQWGGIYSYDNFLLTFNTDDPRTIVETFRLTELNKPLVFKDIAATCSLAFFLSIEDNGVLTTEAYLDFYRVDIRKFTVFLTQQRRAHIVELASAIPSVTKSWKSVFLESENVDGTTEEKTEDRSLAKNGNVSDRWNI
jgi:hypothetical protein